MCIGEPKGGEGLFPVNSRLRNTARVQSVGSRDSPAADGRGDGKRTADKAGLELLAADQLSYGHSSGKVQNRAEFVDGVVTRKAVVKSLGFPQLTVAVAGDAAIARHLYVSDSETEGKPDHTRIGVLAVWQKQDGNWKLWPARPTS
jgi:Domain of unknown function (DUF4440)